MHHGSDDDAFGFGAHGLPASFGCARITCGIWNHDGSLTTQRGLSEARLVGHTRQMLVGRTAGLSDQNEFSFGRVVEPNQDDVARELFLHKRNNEVGALERIGEESEIRDGAKWWPHPMIQTATVASEVLDAGCIVVVVSPLVVRGARKK